MSSRKLTTGELCLDDTGKLCYGEVDTTGKVQAIPLEDVRAYQAKYGAHAAGVARFVLESLGRKERKLSPSHVWPISKSGFHLKPYQMECAENIITRKNGRALLMLPMGFGKTPVAAVLAAYYGGPTIVIMQASKLADFKETFESWGGDKFRHIECIAEGAKGVQFLNSYPLLERTGCVVMMSYELASTAAMQEALAGWRFRTLIVDEADAIKNAETKRAKAIFSISRGTACCVLMTGTPIRNRGNELFALLHTVYPEAFPNFYAFSERYCGGAMRMGRWQEMGLPRLTELRLLRDLFCVNATEEQIEAARAALPPKKRSMVVLPEPPEDFVKRFRVLEKSEADQRERNKTIRDPKLFEILDRKRMATASHPMREMTSKAKVVPVAKYVVSEMLPRLGEKQSAVVFCHFEDFALGLQHELETLGYKSVLLTGKTPAAKRHQMIIPFRDGTRPDNCRILILTMQASCKGINLQPGVVEMALAEMAFVPADMKQAEDRIHRLGATHEMNVSWLVLRPSYDEHVLQMQHTKERVDTSVFGPSK
jgi:SNF2 family DNA or RNA helicase